MWLIKDKEMININDIEHIEYSYYEEDNEYELVFSRYGKEIAYFFFKTEKEVKEKADQIFSELGLNMTTAINIFLRTAIREHGIPFSLKLDIPNEATVNAIEEGRRIASDKSVESYSNIDELKAALDI